MTSRGGFLIQSPNKFGVNQGLDSHFTEHRKERKQEIDFKISDVEIRIVETPVMGNHDLRRYPVQVVESNFGPISIIINR